MSVDGGDSHHLPPKVPLFSPLFLFMMWNPGSLFPYSLNWRRQSSSGFTRPSGSDKSEAEVHELSAARGGALPILPLTLLWEFVQGIGRGNLLLGETVLVLQLGSVGGLGRLTKAGHICSFRWLGTSGAIQYSATGISRGRHVPQQSLSFIHQQCINSAIIY